MIIIMLPLRRTIQKKKSLKIITHTFLFVTLQLPQNFHIKKQFTPPQPLIFFSMIQEGYESGRTISQPTHDKH